MGVPDVINTTYCCIFHRYIQQNKTTSHNPIESKTFTLILIKVKVMSLCMPQGHRSGGNTPHIHNLGTKVMWVVSFMPPLPYSWYPFNRWLCRFEGWFHKMRGIS